MISHKRILKNLKIEMWALTVVAFFTVVVLVFAGGGDDPYIVGNFKYNEGDSNPNPKFMEAIGLTPEQIKEAAELAPKMAKTVTFANNTFTCKISAGGKEIENVFEVDKEFQLKSMFGDPVKATATFQRGRLTIIAQFPAGEVNMATICNKEGCDTKAVLKGSNEISHIRWVRV